ncbi:DUF4809 family protein [Enterococcus ratti]|uniref:DUF4809 family protein n=1 Tax=Enterococcus ratti TaxID=150033 RepID=UPI0035138A95
MVEVQLTRKSELTEGGCNACGIVNAAVYMLQLGTKKATISDLSVGSLVDSLALLEGYEGEDIYEMLGEIRQLRKSGKIINVCYEQEYVQFQLGDEKLKVKNIEEGPILYKQTNQILKQFFELGPYEFKEIKEKVVANFEWKKQIEEQTKKAYLFQ